MVAPSLCPANSSMSSVNSGLFSRIWPHYCPGEYSFRVMHRYPSVPISLVFVRHLLARLRIAGIVFRVEVNGFMRICVCRSVETVPARVHVLFFCVVLALSAVYVKIYFLFGIVHHEYHLTYEYKQQHQS